MMLNRRPVTSYHFQQRAQDKRHVAQLNAVSRMHVMHIQRTVCRQGVTAL